MNAIFNNCKFLNNYLVNNSGKCGGKNNFSDNSQRKIHHAQSREENIQEIENIQSLGKKDNPISL